MRLTFVIHSLGTGGAERVLANLVAGFNGLEHNVAVVTFADDVPDYYTLPAGVKRIHTNLAGEANSLWGKLIWTFRRFWRLRKVIKSTQPDVVISFMDVTNVTVLIALTGTSIPVIVTEHADPITHPIRSRFWGRLRRWLYPRARALVAPSTGITEAFEWMPVTKCEVIPNPLPPESEQSAQSYVFSKDFRYHLVSMGRFIPLKGFDLLLDAFAMIAERFPAWDLTIFGDGELRPDLEVQRDALGLSGRVQLPGIVPAQTALSGADVFVLSSRSEGFGNVLIEAMTQGVPPVSFNCRTGPADIITHEEDGLLVPPEDVSALAASMARLMTDETLRHQLSQKAMLARSCYALTTILDEWMTLFDTKL